MAIGKWSALLTQEQLEAFTEVEIDFDKQVEGMIQQMMQGRVQRRLSALMIKVKDLPSTELNAVLQMAEVEADRRKVKP
jgi:hypothetical protein